MTTVGQIKCSTQNRVVKLFREQLGYDYLDNRQYLRTTMNTRAKQTLYDNPDKDEVLAVAVHNAVCENMQDGWRDNAIKVKKSRMPSKAPLTSSLIVPMTSSNW